MSAARWLRFDPQHPEQAEAVVLGDDEARAIRRDAYGQQVAHEGETVFFSTSAPIVHYVLLEPSSPGGRAERDRRLSPELLTRFAPIPVGLLTGSFSVQTRLRQLADALDAGFVPYGGATARITLLLDEVPEASASRLAVTLMARLPGAYLETGPSMVSVRLDRDGGVPLLVDMAAPPDVPAAVGGVVSVLAETGGV